MRNRVILTLDVLLREAVFGLLLWSGAAGKAGLRLPLYMLGLVTILTWTWHFGLTRPAAWRTVLAESGLLFFGSICIANLLLAGFGLAPWWYTP